MSFYTYRIPRKRATKRHTRPELTKRFRPAVKVMSDGREICNLKTAEGLRIYKSRISDMAIRQGGRCCNCRRLFSDYDKPTFEHEIPRGLGGGWRDDRIEINGKRVNGASHLICNNKRGSKRTPIWKGEQ